MTLFCNVRKRRLGGILKSKRGRLKRIGCIFVPHELINHRVAIVDPEQLKHYKQCESKITAIYKILKKGQ